MFEAAQEAGLVTVDPDSDNDFWNCEHCGSNIDSLAEGKYPMGPTSTARLGSIYVLKVTLVGATPPVWRTVQVPSALTLHMLHSVIQAAMGWEDYHLYQFEIGGTKYGEPDPSGMMQIEDARRVSLGDQVRAADTFTYEYDFGDSWLHQIVVEQELSSEPDVRYPVCVGGEGACPPEDSGGIYGYLELLENLSEPAHEQHSEVVSWIGEDIDPRAFDLAASNARLVRVR